MILREDTSVGPTGTTGARNDEDRRAPGVCSVSNSVVVSASRVSKVSRVSDVSKVSAVRGSSVSSVTNMSNTTIWSMASTVGDVSNSDSDATFSNISSLGTSSMLEKSCFDGEICSSNVFVGVSHQSGKSSAGLRSEAEADTGDTGESESSNSESPTVVAKDRTVSITEESWACSVSSSCRRLLATTPILSLALSTGFVGVCGDDSLASTSFNQFRVSDFAAQSSLALTRSSARAAQNPDKENAFPCKLSSTIM
mmetsp:Transcript_2020/g.5779  ORF Transcript_2020/g.5779 Transcript_2020/m.5779 type:complete len:254 (+) Transcript_2020:1104-1865(+)